MNSRIVMIDCAKPGHAAPPMGPVANAARMSASRTTSWSRSGAAGPAAAPLVARVTAASRSRGDAGEVERAVEEAGHGHVIGRDQGGRGAGPEPAGLTGDPERREPRLVRRAEIEPGDRDEVRGGGRRWSPVRVGQRVLDGKPHVGGAQLGLQRAVDEADGRVDHALRVDDDLDVVIADIVQPVRFDDLQALVGERRRVDGDLRAHRPGRVAQGLGRRDRGHRRGVGVEERAAGCGEDERRDAGHRLADEALPDRRVLRVDRAQPGERARERIGGRRRGDTRRRGPAPAA